MMARDGGITSGTTVNSGGVETAVRGKAINATVNSGGTQTRK
jgi:autotransporter passenger strand-loop-strand repeat protein